MCVYIRAREEIVRRKTVRPEGVRGIREAVSVSYIRYETSCRREKERIAKLAETPKQRDCEDEEKMFSE